MIPRIFRNLNAFINGGSYAGKVSECTPPSLKLKTEEGRYGGMDVPIEHDMGMETLIANLTLPEYNTAMAKTFGKDGTNIVMRGAYQDEAKNTSAVVITLTGMTKELDSDPWKPGQKAEYKGVFTCTYYKLEIDGATIHEIDPANMIRIIDGVDQLAAQRTALGI